MYSVDCVQKRVARHLIESKNRVIILEEGSPEAFQHLVEWISGDRFLHCDKPHDELIYAWSHRGMGCSSQAFSNAHDAQFDESSHKSVPRLQESTRLAGGCYA